MNTTKTAERPLTQQELGVILPEVRELHDLAERYRVQLERVSRLTRGLWGEAAELDTDRLVVRTPAGDT